MSERILPLRSVTTDREVVTGAWVVSGTDRSRSLSAYHTIRVGVARGSGVDWLGDWSGAKRGLSANVRFSLTGELDLNFPLEEGEEIVAGVNTIGSPTGLDGIKLEVRGREVGEVGSIQSSRPDGDYPGASAITGQLFQTPDSGGGTAMDALVSRLNDTSITEWAVSVLLTDG